MWWLWLLAAGLAVGAVAYVIWELRWYWTTLEAAAQDDSEDATVQARDPEPAGRARLRT